MTTMTNTTMRESEEDSEKEKGEGKKEGKRRKKSGLRESAMVSEARNNDDEGPRSSWTIYEGKVGHKCNYGQIMIIELPL